MFDKKFNIIRYIILFISIVLLFIILLHERSLKRVENNKISVDTIIEKTKEYIKDNEDYYNEIINEKDIEIRINTIDLVTNGYINSNDNFKGYVKVFDKEYEYIEESNLLIDKLIKNDDLFIENSNEGMPYDISYVFKGEPNNYIKYNDKLYRIIGITNSMNLKVISVDNETVTKWASGSINYLKEKIEEEKIGSKGIFYVGFVRTETKDITQILKNEKRNNNYTKIVPKYYGYSSYINISDIINASKECSFNSLLDINSENCNSYLFDMLKNTYTSNTSEGNNVYYVDENNELKTTNKLEDVNIKRVIYIQGLTKAKGDGSKDNPYIIE